jgi:hypothetical protein
MYPWKAELAGKKAKCKCGALMKVPASSSGGAGRPLAQKNGTLGGSSIIATRPRPTPKPVAVADPGDSSGFSGSSQHGEVEEVVAPPPLSRSNGAAASKAVTPEAVTKAINPKAAASSSERPPLKWAPALKWLGIGVVIGIWAIYEFAQPEDLSGRKRGLRIIVALANAVIPHGGAILLSLLAGFFLVMGVLILLGKAKDDDYEHEQNEGAWPKSRGRR